jgi:TetR/AcrR family transcriptional regulator, tetracycline repressor protein
MPGEMSGAKQRTGEPAKLTRDRIVDEALALVEREGADGLTMRNLGAALGVDPTAVYRHFRDKDEILLAMADRLFAEMADGIRPHEDWCDVLRDNAWKARRVYLSHPAMARMLSVSPEVLGNHQRIAEALLGALRASGLSEQDASLAYHANVNYVAGVSSLDAELPEGGGYDSWRRAYASLPAEEFPNCVAAAPNLFPDDDAQFEFGLELLIEAISARAARRGAAS